MVTTLLTIFIVLCIVGVLLWGLRQIPGLPPIVTTALYVVVGVLLLLWLLRAVQGGSLGLHL